MMVINDRCNIDHHRSTYLKFSEANYISTIYTKLAIHIAIIVFLPASLCIVTPVFQCHVPPCLLPPQKSLLSHWKI